MQKKAAVAMVVSMGLCKMGRACRALGFNRSTLYYEREESARKLAEGGAVRILSIIDEYTRECLYLRGGRSFPARRVIDALEEVMVCQGRKPDYVRSDNGPEFVARSVQKWLEQARIGARYIEPGSPWEPTEGR